MWLLVDDEKNIQCDIIVRTAHVAKIVLAGLHSELEGLYLDHDLGMDSSGLDVLKWAIQNDMLPNSVQLITMNPVGKKEMEFCLRDAGYALNYVTQIWHKKS